MGIDFDTNTDIGIGIGNAVIEEWIISNGTRRGARVKFDSAHDDTLSHF
ncbi:MAG TPA: hypothetical protein VK828_03090 [Terriglobales bacterium]|jgi:hypothetical protein|nr:hypothetical protein [Terriglobales bacterium]